MGLQDLASPAIIGSFYEQLQDEWSKSWASSIGWLNSGSTQETETYKWLGMVPKFREWLGGRNATHPKVESYSIRNRLWEQTLEFSVDDLRRDKTAQIMIRIGELAQSGAAFWEDLLIALINANSTCYDGLSLFSTAHPVKEMTAGSTTVKNSITTTEVGPLDVVSATAPTPDEAAKIVLGMVGHFMTFTSDQGHLLNANARKFTLMAATPSIWGPLQTAVNQPTLTSGASNPLSGLQSKGYSFDVILNPLLTSATDLIYMFRTDAKLKPFILQEEYGTKVSVVGAGSEEEFKNRRHLFGTERLGNAGVGLWQYALKAQMT
jgi:phage major head subunit gpT-like protein